MSDTHAFYNQYVNRMNKKRGSVGSDLKLLERKIKAKEPKQFKQKITELSIDLNSHKNSKSTSITKNITHRLLDSQNLCELREEVEQLRMENESLRQELKTTKNTENQLKYQVRKLEREISLQIEMKATLEKEFQKLEDKLHKYAEKIKELFENLIHEKRRNVGLDPPANIAKVRMVFSPSNMPISNSLNLRKFEQEGELDYFNSAKHLYRKDYHDYLKLNNYQSLEHKNQVAESFENSPTQGRGMGPDTFANNRY